jgi:hypothetical protein
MQERGVVMNKQNGLTWKDVKSLMREEDLQYFRKYRKEPSNDEVVFPNVIASGPAARVFYKDGSLVQSRRSSSYY